MHSVGRLVVPIIPSHPCYIPKFPFRVIAMCPLLPWILSGPPKTCTSLDGFHWICNWIWLLCVDYSTYHAYPIPKSPKALLCLYCNKNWPRSWLSWKASSWYRISYICFYFSRFMQSHPWAQEACTAKGDCGREGEFNNNMATLKEGYLCSISIFLLGNSVQKEC